MQYAHNILVYWMLKFTWEFSSFQILPSFGKLTIMKRNIFLISNFVSLIMLYYFFVILDFFFSFLLGVVSVMLMQVGSTDKNVREQKTY
jgi:hypothetical protein